MVGIMSDNNIKNELFIKKEGPGDIDPRPSAVFLLSAKDKITADAYEAMLIKNGIPVMLESRGPGGRYAVVSEIKGSIGASPVNLYVSEENIERARALVEAFDNDPIVYNTPTPPLNQKSRSGRLFFAIIIFFVFVVPLGVSLYIIGERILRGFFR